MQKRQRLPFVVLVTLATCCPAIAGGLQRGDTELSFRLSYENMDLGSNEGIDLGSRERVEASISSGWLLTAWHELGLTLAYVRDETDGGNVFQDFTTDGSVVGAFYNLNFKNPSVVTPYVGLRAGVIGSDLGDVYDLLYGAEAGLKVYPFHHGGFLFHVAWARQQGAEIFIPDADALVLGAGMLLKF